jgi:Ankyrin repeat
MSKSKKPKVSLADRRGVFPPDVYSDSWDMTLIQMPGRISPVDLDELLDRMIERGIVGAARRDIGAELHAQQIRTPAGGWGLLVALPGQSWAYLLPGHRAEGLSAQIAGKAGVRVIDAGYSDFSNATAFCCVENDGTLVRFESCGLGAENELVEQYSGGADEAESQTLFTGTRLPKDWLKQFDAEGDVLEALAKEFDAFIPYIGAQGHGGAVQISGFDRKELKPKDYLRIDLIGFGNTRLEPAPADFQLRDAILAGDAHSIRSAIADGANLLTVPDHYCSALHLALGASKEGESRRTTVATLLELGADANDPGGESPIHALLEPLFVDEAEVIDVLSVLTAHGADVNARGKESLTKIRSPLHVAAQNAWLAIAKFLVSKGADVHATDVFGHIPRQTAKRAENSIRSFGEADAKAKYAPIIAFLADAEAGRADLEWQKDAAEASRRELRRQREMKLALGEIGAGFKALSKVMGSDPSPEALADVITLTQPDEIHLTPSEAKWPSEAARAESAALLAALGFEPIGRYSIPEMPKIQLEAYHHPREQLYAALYDAAGQMILDLVRYGHDGTRLTVTNNTTPPETHFDIPDRRTIRLPGAPPADLLRAVRAEPEPAGGIARVLASEFVPRYEDTYRREIKARKRQGRRK